MREMHTRRRGLTEHDVGEILRRVDLPVVMGAGLLLRRPRLRGLKQHGRGPANDRQHGEQEAPDEDEQHPRNAEEHQVRRSDQNRNPQAETADETSGRQHVGEDVYARGARCCRKGDVWVR